MCRAIVSLRERGCPGTFLGRLEEGGAHGSDCCEGVVKGGQQVGRARDGGGSLASLEMVLACWACEHCTSVGLNSLWGDAVCVSMSVCKWRCHHLWSRD